MSRLQDHYRTKVAPELTEKFGYKSPMQVPRITKITLNMGVSEAVADKKVMENAVGDLTKISGQKPVVIRPRRPSPASRSAKARPSARWSRCAAPACTNSWTVS
jgi:ribosomal protein L5